MEDFKKSLLELVSDGYRVLAEYDGQPRGEQTNYWLDANTPEGRVHVECNLSNFGEKVAEFREKVAGKDILPIASPKGCDLF